MRLVGLLAGFLVFVAQPAFAQFRPPPPSLEQRLAALATENSGEYGIAAMDLETGAIVAFNGDRPFPMASTMKIAVAAAYLAEVDAGRRSLHETIGGSTAVSLMDAMITRSNNHATDVLIATLGGPGAIDRWLRAHQLSGIRVDRNIAQLLSDRRDLRDIRDSSTPVAMLGLLRLINSGPALSPGSRALLLDMMRRCATGSNRIRGLLPRGAQVAHKTGTLNGYTGDVGYMTTSEGRRIAVVFFARGGENRPAVISTAARAIYDTFGTEQAPALQGRQGLQGLGGRITQAATGGVAGPPHAPSRPAFASGTATPAQGLQGLQGRVTQAASAGAAAPAPGLSPATAGAARPATGLQGLQSLQDFLTQAASDEAAGARNVLNQPSAAACTAGERAVAAEC